MSRYLRLPLEIGLIKHVEGLVGDDAATDVGLVLGVRKVINDGSIAPDYHLGWHFVKSN